MSSLNSRNGFVIYGAFNDLADAAIGLFLSTAGNFNGDGFDDILVGDSRVTLGANISVGQSFIVYGCNYTTHLCIK